MAIPTACPPKKHKRSYKNLFTTQKKTVYRTYLQGFWKLPASAIYSALFIRFFQGIHRQLSSPFQGYLWPGDYVCIMCHHSSIFLSNDLLLHSDSKTHWWANHQAGEIRPQSHDRDIAKTNLSYVILNHHCQSWNLQFIQFIPSQTCQARGQQPHFILFLDTSPFAASNATALHRAVGNEVEVLTVPKALPPMEEPLQDWLEAPEVAEAISKMLGKNDQKIGGDEAAWCWRFFFPGRMWHVVVILFDFLENLSWTLLFLGKDGTKWVTDTVDHW